MPEPGGDVEARSVDLAPGVGTLIALALVLTGFVPGAEPSTATPS